MYEKYIKRFLDITVAILMLVILLPILLIVTIAIKLDSKGPAIFKQERTGKNGKIFKIYKFRTMKVEEYKNGKRLSHDERLTRVGAIIRKTSIDELPQLVNILKGEMSFVGPRPWIPEYYKYFNTEQKKRVSVLPGITGLAQAKGRNSIDIFQKIKYDVEYTKSVSILMDIKVVIGTIKTIFIKDSAEIKQEGIDDEINMLKAQ